MAYIDGFVIAVPKSNRQAFIDHAKSADSMFIELGALRIVECWADDVPDGTTTDFRKAVKTQDDEDVIFSWIEWPDKATRDAAYAAMMDPDALPEGPDFSSIAYDPHGAAFGLVGPRK